MRVMYEQEVKIQARNRVRAAILADVHHTNHGARWHASFQCASQRTANVTYTLRPCKECAHTLGENWLGVETAALEAAEAALDAAETAYAAHNAAESSQGGLSTGVNSTPSNELARSPGATAAAPWAKPPLMSCCLMSILDGWALHCAHRAMATMV